MPRYERFLSYVPKYLAQAGLERGYFEDLIMEGSHGKIGATVISLDVRHGPLDLSCDFEYDLLCVSNRIIDFGSLDAVYELDDWIGHEKTVDTRLGELISYLKISNNMHKLESRIQDEDLYGACNSSRKRDYFEQYCDRVEDVVNFLQMCSFSNVEKSRPFSYYE